MLILKTNINFLQTIKLKFKNYLNEYFNNNLIYNCNNKLFERLLSRYFLIL